VKYGGCQTQQLLLHFLVSTVHSQPLKCQDSKFGNLTQETGPTLILATTLQKRFKRNQFMQALFQTGVPKLLKIDSPAISF